MTMIAALALSFVLKECPKFPPLEKSITRGFYIRKRETAVTNSVLGTGTVGVSGIAGEPSWAVMGGSSKLDCIDADDGASKFLRARELDTTSTNGGTTKYLVCEGFFTASDIGQGNILDGIEVNVTRRQSAGTSRTFNDSTKQVQDKHVYLILDNVMSGTDHAVPTTRWPTDFTTVTYGSLSDLWSTTANASRVIKSTFGCAIQASSLANSNSGDTTYNADITYVSMTIHFH